VRGGLLIGQELHGHCLTATACLQPWTRAQQLRPRRIRTRTYPKHPEPGSLDNQTSPARVGEGA
jgi:hypothetical protein